MNELFQQLTQLLQNNQILSTVAGGSVIVWLVSNIKTIFSKLVDGITALISFRIVNTYEETRAYSNGFYSDAQLIFNRFLSSSKVLWERTRDLDLSSANSIYVSRNGNVRGSSNLEVLTYGFSLRIVFGKLVVVNREIEKGQKVTVTTYMRVFFASKEKFLRRIRKTIEDSLLEEAKKSSKGTTIRVYNGEASAADKNRREMDSIYTNNNEHYELLETIRNFLDNEAVYRKLSYPYTFSALLHGEPGCGKSSTILAVASALRRDIMYVNLSKITLGKLLDYMNCSSDRILVFEDIDALTTAVGENRDGKESSSDEGQKMADEGPKKGYTSLDTSLLGISLSDLLNITDGLLASDGTICLFTTNHIERLDPAFLRSGRMNKVVKFSRLNRSTAARMLNGNLGWDVSPTALKDGINPADLQAAILEVALGKDNGEKLRKEFFV